MAVAIAAAHNFRQHAAGIGAARQQVAGAAVVGEDQVVAAKGVDDADGGRFLADRGAGAGHRAGGAAGDDGFLVGANQQHLLEQVPRVDIVQRLVHDFSRRWLMDEV